MADESIRLLWMWIVKFLVRIDDALDLFAEHAVGGIIGLLVNAIFARSDIIALDDVNTSVRAHLSLYVLLRSSVDHDNPAHSSPEGG